MEYDVKRIAGLIDHSSLKGYATWENIRSLIDEASEFGAYSVCIEPLFAERARHYIDKNRLDVRIDLTLDFPLGALPTTTREKLIMEFSGICEEVDLVTQIGLVRSGFFEEVERDINRIVETAHSNGLIIKIITEDAYTNAEQKRRLYEIVCRSKADFIKTSTGFAEADFAKTLGNETGAVVRNVELMAEIIKKTNSSIGIKVAGGIRSYSEALALLRASGMPPEPRHFRIGVSRTRQILSEAGLTQKQP
ncbi:MAG: 2-deoxyribose-5-phosphate aldolase [Thermoplasmata archaeon]